MSNFGYSTWQMSNTGGGSNTASFASTASAITYTFPAFSGTIGVMPSALTSTWLMFTDANGNITGSANATLTAAGVITVAAPIVLTAAAAVSSAGQVGHDTTQKQLSSFTSGIKQMMVGTIFTATADGTNGAATSATSIIGTGVGTKTLPGSFFVAGKTVRVRGMGTFTTHATTPGTATIKLMLGAVEVATSAAVTPTINLTSKLFEFEFLLTCRTATTIQGAGALYMDAAIPAIGVPNTTTATIVNATSYAVDVTSTNSAASGCIWTTKVCTIEVLN